MEKFCELSTVNPQCDLNNMHEEVNVSETHCWKMLLHCKQAAAFLEIKYIKFTVEVRPNVTLFIWVSQKLKKKTIVFYVQPLIPINFDIII